MRVLAALLVGLGLVLPVQAQHQHHGSPGAMEKAGAGLAEGTVKKIDRQSGEVVLQHGPIESIGMPPMTMAFGVADKAWLDQWKPGDRIRFEATMRGGQPVVSRYQKAP